MPGAYFYPRSPCGERHDRRVNLFRFEHFYPRSPCGERLTTTITICIAPKFLSTLSLRRATIRQSTASRINGNFYPRSPCGERQPGEHHASSQQEFLSTLSLRRATNARPETRRPCAISIHALLAESDVMHALKLADPVLFLSTLSLRRATASVISILSR